MLRMATKASNGSARTAPKGAATRSRAEAENGRSWLSPTLQWVLVAVAGILIAAAIFYFGRDTQAPASGTSPAEVTTDLRAPGA
jgi:hypothetical protein